jgi:Tol biopolymer transport system component
VRLTDGYHGYYLEFIRSLTWSPEGDKLAFGSYRDGHYAISIYSFADAKLTPIAIDQYDGGPIGWRQ